MTDKKVPDNYRMPFIHGNGTSAEQLIEDRYEAIYALNGVISILAKIGPNGRDYYPYNSVHEGAFGVALDEAVDQHRTRMKRLQQCVDELEAEIEHIEQFQR